MTETGTRARPRTKYLDLFHCLDRHVYVKDPTHLNPAEDWSTDDGEWGQRQTQDQALLHLFRCLDRHDYVKDPTLKP